MSVALAGAAPPMPPAVSAPSATSTPRSERRSRRAGTTWVLPFIGGLLRSGSRSVGLAKPRWAGEGAGAVVRATAAVSAGGHRSVDGGRGRVYCPPDLRLPRVAHGRRRDRAHVRAVRVHLRRRGSAAPHRPRDGPAVVVRRRLLRRPPLGQGPLQREGRPPLRQPADRTLLRRGRRARGHPG